MNIKAMHNRQGKAWLQEFNNALAYEIIVYIMTSNLKCNVGLSITNVRIIKQVTRKETCRPYFDLKLPITNVR